MSQDKDKENLEPKTPKVENTRNEFTGSKETFIKLKVLVNRRVTIKYDNEIVTLQPLSINSNFKRSKLQDYNKKEISILLGGL